MTKYNLTNPDFSAQDAYELAKKASRDPAIQKMGVSIHGSKKNISMLYHAASEFGLNITGAEYDEKKVRLTRRIRNLRLKEWNEFIAGQRAISNSINTNDKLFLKNLNGIDLNTLPLKPWDNIKQKANPARQSHDNYGKSSASLRELNELTGLGNVKSQINDLADYMKVTSARKKAGLPATMMGQHLVFTGNPGTGKTTVARIVGDIYREFDLLKKGHFTEIGGRDLIAEYIGQTTEKVKEIVEGALDGVLFIDEAYALVPEDSQKDFGPEAVAALIKYMEDYRDRLVVIVAGYGKEMEILLNSNPGLKSRFKTKIDFTDYTKEEMAEIFEYFCNNDRYSLTREAETQLSVLCAEMDSNKGANFGNGRAVRNAFDKTIMNQCRRLARLPKRPKKAELQLFHSSDIPELNDFDW